MSKVIDTFGRIVSDKVQKDPDAARRLLLLGYRAKRLQLRHFPDKRLSPASRHLAVMLMDAMIAPLAQPERAAVVSIFLPCELLQAADLVPFSAEGISDYISGASAEKIFLESAEAAGVPESFCSFHKVFIGAAESGMLPRPRFIANTTLACDANMLTFRRMAEFYGINHFVVDVPYEVSPQSVKYVEEQLRDLARFVEKETGKTISEDRLAAAVERSRRSNENYLRCLSLLKGHYVNDEITSQMYAAVALMPLLGTPETERYTKLLLEDIQKAPPAVGKRLLWMHVIPYWQRAVRDRLNFSERAQIVACDMGTASLRQVMDPAKPYESMARRLVCSSFNGPIQRRIDEAKYVAELTGAHGAIYFCHWGCKQTLGGAALVKKTLEAEGLPTLILDGDGCDRSFGGEGQAATRLEAFLELLEGGGV